MHRIEHARTLDESTLLILAAVAMILQNTCNGKIVDKISVGIIALGHHAWLNLLSAFIVGNVSCIYAGSRACSSQFLIMRRRNVLSWSERHDTGVVASMEDGTKLRTEEQEVQVTQLKMRSVHFTAHPAV